MTTAGTTRPTTRSSTPEVRANQGLWRSAHLVGVCGSGMKALAELLTGLGWTVSGSDNNASETVVASMARRGFRIHPGHHGQFLGGKTDLLFYSPAICPENPARVHTPRLVV